MKLFFFLGKKEALPSNMDTNPIILLRSSNVSFLGRISLTISLIFSIYFFLCTLIYEKITQDTRATLPYEFIFESKLRKNVVCDYFGKRERSE